MIYLYILARVCAQALYLADSCLCNLASLRLACAKVTVVEYTFTPLPSQKFV